MHMSNIKFVVRNVNCSTLVIHLSGHSAELLYDHCNFVYTLVTEEWRGKAIFEIMCEIKTIAEDGNEIVFKWFSYSIQLLNECTLYKVVLIIPCLAFLRVYVCQPFWVIKIVTTLCKNGKVQNDSNFIKVFV